MYGSSINSIFKNNSSDLDLTIIIDDNNIEH